MAAGPNSRRRQNFQEIQRHVKFFLDLGVQGPYFRVRHVSEPRRAKGCQYGGAQPSSLSKPVRPVLLCEDIWMHLSLIASATLIKKIDVAFDTSTLLRNLAKDADYMAAVAELSRP